MPFVRVVPEFIVPGNIADLIADHEIVLVSVNNCASLKLISDHGEKLKNVAIIAGRCDWTQGVVNVFLRRNGKNLTPPLANRYHPDILEPKDRNPGELSQTERKLANHEPISIVTTNMVASLMLVLFEQVQTGRFRIADRTDCEFYVDTLYGQIKPRARFASDFG